MLDVVLILALFLIGRVPRFGNSHIFGLRPQNLLCNFGLSWLREIEKNVICVLRKSRNLARFPISVLL